MIMEDQEEQTDFETSQEEECTSSSVSNFSNSRILEKFSRASSINGTGSSTDKMEKDNLSVMNLYYSIAWS